MRPFLYLDNWHAPQARTRFDACLSASGLPLETVRTNDGEFPDHARYSGAFVSPSFDGVHDDFPWIRREHEVLRSLAAAGVPMAGLCFGSQILASALVGRGTVFVRRERESGRGEIRLTAAAAGDPLAAGLPARMPAFHWHADEVKADHPDIIVIADSRGCANQIWRWARGPAWGVQPHLEHDRAGLAAWFADNARMFEAGGMTRSRLAAEAHDDSAGFGFLRNFIDYVLGRERRREEGAA